SVRSTSAMQADSRSASFESKRHSSTLVALREKSAKFTPEPSHVAPSGWGLPGQTLMARRLSAAPFGAQVEGVERFFPERPLAAPAPRRQPAADHGEAEA